MRKLCKSTRSQIKFVVLALMGLGQISCDWMEADEGAELTQVKNLGAVMISEDFQNSKQLLPIEIAGEKITVGVERIQGNDGVLSIDKAAPDQFKSDVQFGEQIWKIKSQGYTLKFSSLDPQKSDKHNLTLSLQIDAVLPASQQLFFLADSVEAAAAQKSADGNALSDSKPIAMMQAKPGQWRVSYAFAGDEMAFAFYTGNAAAVEPQPHWTADSLMGGGFSNDEKILKQAQFDSNSYHLELSSSIYQSAKVGAYDARYSLGISSAAMETTSYAH